MENPYQVNSILQTKSFPSPFGLVYWSALAFGGLASILVTPFVAPLGLLGLSTVVFATVRSFAFHRMARSGQLSSESRSYPNRTIPFFFISLGIGLGASTASCVSFVAVCVPVGAAVFSFGTYSLPDWISFSFIIASIFFAIVVAVWAGWIVIRLSMPTTLPPPILVETIHDQSKQST